MPNYSKYNAKDWSVQLGSRYITGFDEDMFTWEKDEAFGEYTVGAQGDAMFNEMNNDLYTLTITLQPTSPSVDYMYELLNTRAEFSVLGINKSLRKRFGGSHGRITEAPSLEAAAEGNPLEFVIQVADGYTENA